MADIKLFEITPGMVKQLESTTVALERTLQTQIEGNLEDFLGIRFLASEYTTGKTHAGRIDTLGIDENGCPVIIEYKRTSNQNVINQGLFYLDWLLDHRGEFELVVMKKLGQEAADTIDWSAPRLICIAGDFTKYDEHAVQQINRNIELIRYRSFEDRLLLFELVNAVTADAGDFEPGEAIAPQKEYKTVTQSLESASDDLKALFTDLREQLLSLGDDVQMKTLKLYFAFKRIRNFACVEVRPSSSTLMIYTRLNPDDVELVEGFTRDVRNIGHWGTGDLEITLRSHDDFEKAKPLLERAYEAA